MRRLRQQAGPLSGHKKRSWSYVVHFRLGGKLSACDAAGELHPVHHAELQI